jgi:RimJ/RimL family protein N-acetyltransferase
VTASSIPRGWDRHVCERLASIKAGPSEALRLPSVHGGHVTLAPFTAAMVTDDALIEALTRWRAENISGFTRLFRPTFEGTRAWSRSQLIERSDRILFLVRNADGHLVGHVGLSSFDFDAGTCEIDNVVRGERTAPPGTMAEAVAAVLDWAHLNLGPAEIRLRTLAENTRALALYHRLGFVPLSLIPLRRVAADDATEWVEAESNDHIDKFFVLMAHRPQPGDARPAGGK